LATAQDEKKEEVKKTVVDIPKGTGATKVAALWQNKLETGGEEKKVEKQTIDLGGGGASKVAAVWQNREAGAEPEPEIKKTTVEGLGASKLAQQWQKQLEEKPAEPQIERGGTPAKRAGPSALASQWEKTANTTASTASGAKKDLDDLRSMMAKERETVMGGGAPSETFSTDEEEVEILIHILNTSLKAEKIPQIPLKFSSESLWDDLSDGITMCKFFNKTIPDMLDVRVITSKVSDRKDKIDNWNLCVNSARGAGCRLHDVKAEELADADPIAIQKVIYQIAKIGLETDLKMFEDYLADFIPDADPDTLAGMSLDEILLKWINATLKKNGHSRAVANLTSDLQDSFVFTVLLNETLGMSLEADDNELEMAQSIVMSSSEIGKGPVITLQGICDGSYWQNCIFLASLLLTAAEMSN